MYTNKPNNVKTLKNSKKMKASFTNAAGVTKRLGIVNGKGAPTKGAKARTEQIKLRATKEEISNIDLAMLIANDRRNVGNSRMDLFIYLAERYIRDEDMIKNIECYKLQNGRTTTS